MHRGHGMLWRPHKRLEKCFFHSYENHNFTPPLRVEIIGVSRFRAVDFFGSERRRRFSLNVVTLGNAQYNQDGRSGTLAPGDVFLAHKGTKQRFVSGAAGFVHKRFVTLQGAALDAFLRSSGLDRLDKVRPLRPAHVIRLFRRVYREMERREAGYVHRISLLAFDILMELGESIAPDYPPEVRGAIEYMRRNLDRSITLRDVCRQARLSPRHCNRMFHRHIGMPPMRFFLTERMRWGQSLLLNTTQSIKEIAALIGYDDPLYFSAQFCRFAGVCPTKFRKERSGE